MAGIANTTSLPQNLSEPENSFCDFFFASYEHIQLGNNRPRRKLLVPTHTTAAALHNSRVSPIYWEQNTDAGVAHSVRMWVRVFRNGPLQQASQTLAGPFPLLARCTVSLPCSPHGEATVLLSSVTVLTEEAENAHHLFYACSATPILSLRESIFQWRRNQLAYIKSRLLVTIHGSSPPHSVHVVSDSNTALYLVQSSQRTHMFRVSIGEAVRTGVLPPVAEVDAPWPSLADNDDERHQFQAGCLLDTLTGFIIRDTLHQSSTFYLTEQTGTSQQTRVLLELTTEVPQDADGDLVPVCGLSQRMVYLRCRLERPHLDVPFSALYTSVVLEVRVEGAVLRSAEGLHTATWTPCGLQQYRSSARLQHRFGSAKWSVDPLHKVWSRAIGPTFDKSGTDYHALTTRGTAGSGAVVVCESRKVRFPWSYWTGTSQERCRLLFAAHGTCQWPPFDHARDGVLSHQCPYVSLVWWQDGASPFTRWVCANTQCSPKEWFFIFALSCVVSWLSRLLLQRRRVRRLL